MSKEDAQFTIGTILEEGQGVGRDAIHIAMAPVVAATRLAPGQDIGLISDDGVTVGASDKPIGIVDPFLRTMVLPGQRFWMCLYPNTIRGLRHVWEHDAFLPEQPSLAGSKEDREASETWLREFCSRSDCPNYDRLIASIAGALDGKRSLRDEEDDYYSVTLDEEYLFFGGYDAHGEIPPEFWDHVSIVLGRPVPGSKRATSFSCSC